MQRGLSTRVLSLCLLSLLVLGSLSAVVSASQEAEDAQDNVDSSAHARENTEDGGIASPFGAEDGDEVSNPYAYLEKYDMAGLKKYAFDTYPTQVDVDRFTDHKALLNAVMRVEREHDKIAQLRARVRDFVKSASPHAVEQPHKVVIEACKPSQHHHHAEKLLATEVYLGKEDGVDIQVSVVPHDPPQYRKALSLTFKTSFFGLIAAAIVGGKILPPAVMRFMDQRKGIVFSTGMVLNMLSSSLLQTGAFEVYVDGRLVYSKLKTGRIPTGSELSEIILDTTVLAPQTKQPLAARKSKRGKQQQQQQQQQQQPREAQETAASSE